MKCIEAKEVCVRVEKLNKKTKKKELIKVKLGIRLNFDNGNKVVVDGKTYTGPGTWVMKTYKYGTIKVHNPMVPKRYRSGTLETNLKNEPIWEHPASSDKDSSGLKISKFLEAYGQWAKTVMALFEKAELELAQEAAEAA